MTRIILFSFVRPHEHPRSTRSGPIHVVGNDDVPTKSGPLALKNIEGKSMSKCWDCYNLKTRIFHSTNDPVDIYSAMNQVDTSPGIRGRVFKNLTRKREVRVFRCTAGQVKGYRLQVPQMKECTHFN